MLKVLIIDDEPLIREGLKTIIDWNKYGFEVCGEAENGKTGLYMIGELKPDIAIVDIKMPEMNGLEMIEKSKSEGYDCSFIILTAYSDFKFAQKSIELGVNCYILKPIEEAELIEKLSKLGENILGDRNEKQYIDVSISLSKEKVLQSLVMGNLDMDAILRYDRIYGFGFPWNYYQVAIISIDSDCDNDILVVSKMKACIDEFVNKRDYGYVFEINTYLGVLLKNISFTSFNRRLVELQEIIKSHVGKDIIISLGVVADSYDDIPVSYKHAFELMDRKFIFGHKKIIVNNSEEAELTSMRSYSRGKFDSEDIVDALCNAIDINNSELINDLLERTKCHFICSGYNENIIKANYSHMLMMLLNRLSRSNDEAKKDMFAGRDVINEIYNKTSLSELHGYLKYNLASISDELSRLRPANPMKRILDYIERNYSNDIKLEGLAELFNYNSAYLGKLFKSSTGMYFNTYMDNLRVDKAKGLLLEGLKVYQVAEKIGYKDIDYFYKKFKKYTGVSPSDFRERAGR